MSEYPVGHNRLRALDPESLLSVDANDIPLLLAHNYGFLADHGADLVRQATDWLAAHPIIQSDAELTAASALYATLRDHAGISGAVEATRKRVKMQPAQVINSIDNWFADLRADLLPLMQQVDTAQGIYAQAKVIRERAAREAAAKAAQEEADRLLRLARTAGAPDDAIDVAMSAEFKAVVAAIDANATVADLSRTRSAGGTTGAYVRWAWRLVSLYALAEAIVAGTVPVDFITTDDTAINEAIRGKAGRRHVPGLEIYETYSVTRRRGYTHE